MYETCVRKHSSYHEVTTIDPKKNFLKALCTICLLPFKFLDWRSHVELSGIVFIFLFFFFFHLFLQTKILHCLMIWFVGGGTTRFLSRSKTLYIKSTCFCNGISFFSNAQGPKTWRSCWIDEKRGSEKDRTGQQSIQIETKALVQILCNFKNRVNSFCF